MLDSLGPDRGGADGVFVRALCEGADRRARTRHLELQPVARHFALRHDRRVLASPRHVKVEALALPRAPRHRDQHRLGRPGPRRRRGRGRAPRAGRHDPCVQDPALRSFQRRCTPPRPPPPHRHRRRHQQPRAQRAGCCAQPPRQAARPADVHHVIAGRRARRCPLRRCRLCARSAACVRCHLLVHHRKIAARCCRCS